MQMYTTPYTALQASAASLLLSILIGPAVAEPPELGPMPQRGFASGKIVFVDAATGRDSPQCGRQNTPCLTINHGVSRASQIQDDPVAADNPDVSNIAQGLENLVTVQVAAGTYDEAVLITSDWIRLLGAGPGSSIITRTSTPIGDNFWDSVPLLVRGAHPTWVEGFTFIGGARGMALRSGALVFIRDCQFDGINRGLDVLSAFGFVFTSTFSDSALGALVGLNGDLTLRDANITGRGTGIGVAVTGNAAAELSPGDGTLSNQVSDTSFGV